MNGASSAGAYEATLAFEADASAQRLLTIERDRAERLLNGVRLIVLLLLATAALAYAPSLTIELSRVNIAVLVSTIAWTILQYRLFYHRPTLPVWLAVANPIVDITAVSVILGGYALAQSPGLALKSPIFLAYFVILAALPVASNTRKAGAVAALAVVQYSVLVLAFLQTGELETVLDPVAASATIRVSLLDEGAKILLLAVAGVVATYAARWQERLSANYSAATSESERLQSQLAESQLESLKLQLHPHFLFNTLNTITALVHTNPDAAERMVSGLSDLLRMSLGSVGEQEVSLQRELEVLQHYVDIQQVRFNDRLTVSFDIAPDTEWAMVPNLLLQPLVENAIKHGISPRAAPGHIRVSASRREEALCLAVEDDGVGTSREAPHEGVGLGNTRTRLRSLYGNRHRFRAAGGTGGGYAVSIEIPFRVAQARRALESAPA